MQFANKELLEAHKGTIIYPVFTTAYSNGYVYGTEHRELMLEGTCKGLSLQNYNEDGGS